MPLVATHSYALLAVERDFQRLCAARAVLWPEGPLNLVHVLSTILAEEDPLDLRCPVGLGWISVVESAAERAFMMQDRLGACPGAILVDVGNYSSLEPRTHCGLAAPAAYEEDSQERKDGRYGFCHRCFSYVFNSFVQALMNFPNSRYCFTIYTKSPHKSIIFSF